MLLTKSKIRVNKKCLEFFISYDPSFIERTLDKFNLTKSLGIIHSLNEEKTLDLIQKGIRAFLIGKDMKKGSRVKMISRVQELASRGLVHLASGAKVEVKRPHKFPGKPLSEYLKEIKE